MQRIEHDLIPELVAERPASILDLVRDLLGIELVPRDAVTRVTPMPRQVSQLVPPELAVDCAMRVELATGERQAILLEVQLDTEGDKPLVWPQYWAAMRRAIGGGATTLVVIALDRRVEAWAAEILAQVIPAAGRGLVIGPSTTRPLTDSDLARRDPQAALLSALIHAGQPNDIALLPAITEALSTVDRTRGRLVHDLMHKRLSAAAWAALEAQMDLKNYVWTSPFALKHQALGRAEGVAEGRAEGVAEGRAEGVAEGRREQLVRAILSVLEVRGIACTDDVRARLDACADPAMLDTWHRRAVTASTIEDVFAAG